MKNFFKLSAFFFIAFFLGILLLPNAARATVEDFTTYTETDPNGVLTVGATSITVTNMTRQSGAYVVKDAGTGHFTTNFTHLISGQIDSHEVNSGSGSTAFIHLWTLSNSATPALNDDPIVTFFPSANATSPAANLFFNLTVDEGSSDQSDISNAGAVTWGTQYWFTIARSGAAITAKIYSDSARTNLLDTLSVTGSTSQTYRYVVTAHSRGGGTATPTMSGSVSSLTLRLFTTTNDATSIAATSVTLNGQVDEVSGGNYDSRGFNLGTATAAAGNYNLSTSSETGTYTTTGAFSLDVSGLTADTTYYFRAFAASTTEPYSAYGDELTFTTLAASATGGSSLRILADHTPPLRRNANPGGTLEANITQTTISLETNEPAVCKYSTLPFTPDFLMLNSFSNTGNKSHSTVVSGLKSGETYEYYIKCFDKRGNANPDDFLISFEVAPALIVQETPPAPPSPTLFATLTADPSSGQTSLYAVYLTADVFGTATGNVNYIFYCDRSDSGTNITPDYVARYNGVGFASQKSDNACNYLSTGTYYPKIIVERGDNKAESRTKITVTEKALETPPETEKPASEMSVEEIRNEINLIQQKIIELMQQLILLLQMLPNLSASVYGAFFSGLEYLGGIIH